MIQDNSWVRHIRIPLLTSQQHFVEFVNLWTRLQSVELRPGVLDQIVWKLSANREYSAKSAYMAQFLGAMDTNLDQLIWKAWAPPKYKIFAWLAYQNRLWTADRLERRGWPNQKKCPLCRHTDESALHLFAQCRYTRRLWDELGASVPAVTANMNSYDTCDGATHWWKVASASTDLSPKTTITFVARFLENLE